MSALSSETQGNRRSTSSSTDSSLNFLQWLGIRGRRNAGQMFTSRLRWGSILCHCFVLLRITWVTLHVTSWYFQTQLQVSLLLAWLDTNNGHLVCYCFCILAASTGGGAIATKARVFPRHDIADSAFAASLAHTQLSFNRCTRRRRRAIIFWCSWVIASTTARQHGRLTRGKVCSGILPHAHQVHTLAVEQESSLQGEKHSEYPHWCIVSGHNKNNTTNPRQTKEDEQHEKGTDLLVELRTIAPSC